MVVKEVAKLPPVMRRKLLRPEAAGIFSGGSRSRAMVSMDTKNMFIATPCTSSGITNTRKLASGGYAARMKYDTAKITE